MEAWVAWTNGYTYARIARQGLFKFKDISNSFRYCAGDGVGETALNAGCDGFFDFAT